MVMPKGLTTWVQSSCWDERVATLLPKVGGSHFRHWEDSLAVALQVFVTASIQIVVFLLKLSVRPSARPSVCLLVNVRA
jgi:hypothetical protein